ncbi:MAG TPA: tetratricopeptide repeat protein [Flavobacteriales bacterium]|nr:tetratricopeptide repeat protein [Flavobacteriales bacterium]
MLTKVATAKLKDKSYLYDELTLKFYRKQTDSAIKYGKLTLAWAYKANDSVNIAYAHSRMGVLYKNKGLFDSSLVHYFRSIKIQQKNGFKNGIAANYNNIGTVYKLRGQYDKAVWYYHKAINMFTGLKDGSGLNQVLQNIAELYIEIGEEEKARKEFETAAVYFKKHPHKAAEGFLYAGLGQIYARQKKYRLAERYMKQAAQMFEAVAANTDLAHAQIELSKILLINQKKGSADSLIKKIQF